jgi:hypothetical protein
VWLHSLGVSRVLNKEEDLTHHEGWVCLPFLVDEKDRSTYLFCEASWIKLFIGRAII